MIVDDRLVVRGLGPVLILMLAVTSPASLWAQDVDEEFTIEDTEEPIEEEPEDMEFEVEGGDGDGLGVDLDTSVDPVAGTPPAGDEEVTLGESRVAWQDIVVVVRKPFLKMQRLELLPQFGLTINDNMIRHFALVGQLNYFLTDVLSVGAEGQLFQKDFLETYDLVARQDRRLPTINKYNWAASLNMGYVPIYGKFAVLNENIIHWEIFATLGVGVTQTEVIPRNPALRGWTNMQITPNVGLAGRVFLNRWITLNVGVRDYVFFDSYEDVTRSPGESLEASMNAADNALVNHVMFQAGLSFWFPLDFEYSTFR